MITCTKCRTRERRRDHSWCNECLAYNTELHRRKHPEISKKARREAGLCLDCGLPAIHSRCEECAGKHRVRNSRDRLKRIAVVRVTDRIKGHRYRARLLQAPGHYTREEWSAIVESQGGRCNICQVKTKLTVDHIIPLSKGGSN